jgi:hypothetical protein
MQATVRRAPDSLGLELGFDHAVWAAADTLELASFRPEGSSHRPRVRARLLHGPLGLHGIFRVEDRYVRSVHLQPGSPVHEDSCVELFLQPRHEHGYLNFEINAGGTLSASHVTDHRRVPGGLAAFSPLGPEELARVAVRSTLPRTVEPEVETEVDWELAFHIPLELVERRVGPLGPLSGQVWRANLYKCGDATSHPHWASWAPVDERNFHLPRCFGTLRFEG